MRNRRLPAFVGTLVAVALVLAVPLAAQAMRSGLASKPGDVIYLPVVLGPPLVPCSSPPVLVSPINTSNESTLSPLFQWNVGTDPTVTAMGVEIDTDPSFPASSVTTLSILPPTAGATIAQTRYPGDLDPSTTNYWRVFFNCGSIQGPFSATWSFTTAPSGGPLLPAPSLLSPANGSSVSPSQVTFQWSAVAGALDYLVVWQPQSEYPDGSFDYAYTSTLQFTPDSALSPKTPYVWYAQARNAYGDGHFGLSNFATTNGTTAPSAQGSRREDEATGVGPPPSALRLRVQR
ncbi:MAG TPA: hypothetical protein VNL16_09790 [Chloroflexota bacterium]|nr:hypothetical protein [Chloroflexota bacterium]